MKAAPLRYLLLATHVPRSGAGGGMVRYVVELANALAARDDVDLHVLVTDEGAQYFADTLNVKAHLAPSVPIAVRSALERSGAVRSLRDPQFDVIHGTKHLVPRASRSAQTILTVHDMLTFDRPRDYPIAKRWLLPRPYLQSIKSADKLVCVSRATKSRLEHHVPSAARKASVVPLAPSSKLLGVTPTKVDALAGRQVALVVGDAGARKNLQLVVDIWPQVRERLPHAILAAVGPRGFGANKRGERWVEQVSEGAVVALGHVDDQTLRWCYEQADVVLCPSLIEGFGLPAAEAVSFGTPVISSTDPALREASGAGALAIPTTDRNAWVAAIVGALTTPRRTAIPRLRTWAEVADETIAVVNSRSSQLPG